MKAVQAPTPPRRWSKRRLIFTVSALASGVLVLVVAVVGFARSVDFVLGVGSASDALSEVGQIAPDRAASGGTSATTVPAASEPVVTTETSAPVPATTAVATSVVPSGARPAAANSSEATGGAPGETEAAAGSAGTGGLGGGGGTAPTPSGFEDNLRSMLTLFGQTASTMCGQNTCNVGQVCCNFSCGTCVAPGASCDQTQCAGAARAPTAVRCGSGQCNDGQVCCNPSCGICAAPGETCASQTCP
jgi:hypothetical protein